MKKALLFFIVFSFCFLSKSFGQFSVGYHQSALPFVAVGYEIGDRFSPELRIATDIYLEDLRFELIGKYEFLQKEDYEFYAGLGGLISSENGAVVVPVGFVFYPFTERKFGFHLEAAPLIGEDAILRGSWGITYKFGD